MIWHHVTLFLAGVTVGVLLVPVYRWLRPTVDDPPVPPYDWAVDGGLLDVWARDVEGELVAVFPAAWNEELAGALALIEAGRPLAGDEASDNAKRFIEGSADAGTD